jgi:hypothetical protein
MKRIIGFALVALILFPAAAFSQTRSRTAKRKPARTTAKREAGATGPSMAAEVARTTGAARVGDQIKILTRFIYVLGGVIKGIEVADAAAGRNEASPSVIAQTNTSKATVKASLRNVREGLDQLEIHFRGTPELTIHYTQLAGVAAAAAKAEDLAARNQFDQAGRTLLGVVNQLTDVLLDMR